MTAILLTDGVGSTPTPTHCHHRHKTSSHQHTSHIPESSHHSQSMMSMTASQAVLTFPPTPPPLLNERVAQAISSFSSATRLSLAGSSFLIECLSEGAKYGTSASLAVSRRALLSAFSTAHTFHHKTFEQGQEQNNRDGDIFVKLLDKYTNMGISLIHSAFSLTELFAMTGVRLTTSTVQSGIKAASESVRIIDGLFGSTETSRALAAFVSLVKQEINEDEDYALAKTGFVNALASILKAMVAYACLQSVTWRRRRLDDIAEVIYESEVLDGVRQPPPNVLTETAHEELQYDDYVDVQDYNGGGDSLLDDAASVMTTTTTVIEQEILWELESILSGLSTDDDTNPSDKVNTPSALSPNATTTRTSSYRRRTHNRRVSMESILDRFENGPEGRRTWREGSEVVMEQAESRMNGSMASTTSNHSVSAYDYGSLRRQRRTAGSSGIQSPPSEIDSNRSSIVIEELPEKQNSSSQWTLLHTEPAKRISVSSPLTKGPIPVVVEPYLPETSSSSSSSSPSSSSSLSLPIKEDTVDDETPPLPNCDYDEADSILPVEKTKKKKKKYRKSKREMVPAFDEDLSSVQPRSGRGLGTLINTVNSALSRQTHRVRVRIGGIRGSSRDKTSQPLSGNAMAHWGNSGGGSGGGSTAWKRSTASKRTTTTTTKTTRTAAAATTTTTTAATESPDTSISSSPSLGLPQRGRHNGNARLPPRVTSPRAMIESPPPPPPSPPTTSTPDFPNMSLVSATQHFMHYASAAYGHNFLYLLGLSRHHPLHHSDAHHHPNHASFARHIGLPLQDVLLSSYTPAAGTPLVDTQPHMHALVHYVCIDRRARSIVVTLRGTLGLSDILTDMTCGYAELAIAGGRYYTHSGMLESARLLADPRSEVARSVRAALEREPDFGVILCGHSLGGGVAALLAILWSERLPRRRHTSSHSSGSNNDDTDDYTFVTSSASPIPARRRIRCFTYGVPCVSDAELGRYARGLITSVVHGHDAVSTLSWGLLHDYKAISISLYAEKRLAEDIITRCIGLRGNTPTDAPDSPSLNTDTPSSATASSPPPPPPPLHRANTFETAGTHMADSDWYWSLIKTLRADMTARKLYPPGNVYLIDRSCERYHDPSLQRVRECIRARMLRVNNVEERFGELVFAKRMFSDHSPKGYEDCLDALASNHPGKTTPTSGETVAYEGNDALGMTVDGGDHYPSATC